MAERAFVGGIKGTLCFHAIRLQDLTDIHIDTSKVERKTILLNNYFCMRDLTFYSVQLC
jgi:hypothetical protein